MFALLTMFLRYSTSVNFLTRQVGQRTPRNAARSLIVWIGVGGTALMSTGGGRNGQGGDVMKVKTIVSVLLCLLFLFVSGCATKDSGGIVLDVKETRSTRTGMFTALDSSVLCDRIAQTNGPPLEAVQTKSASVHEYRTEHEGGYVFGPTYREGVRVHLRDESRCRWGDGTRRIYRPPAKWHKY